MRQDLHLLQFGRIAMYDRRLRKAHAKQSGKLFVELDKRQVSFCNSAIDQSLGKNAGAGSKLQDRGVLYRDVLRHQPR